MVVDSGMDTQVVHECLVVVHASSTVVIVGVVVYGQNTCGGCRRC